MVANHLIVAANTVWLPYCRGECRGSLLSAEFKNKLIFDIARCLIGAGVGFAWFEIYGLLVGAAVGLLCWPIVYRAGWVICQLYGGLAEPEQPVHFWSWHRRKTEDKLEEKTGETGENKEGKNE
jgi:hypothetical protein